MLIGHGARDSDGHSGTERSRTPSRASTSDRPAGYKAVQEDAARIGGHNTRCSLAQPPHPPAALAAAQRGRPASVARAVVHVDGAVTNTVYRGRHGLAVPCTLHRGRALRSATAKTQCDSGARSGFNTEMWWCRRNANLLGGGGVCTFMKEKSQEEALPCLGCGCGL